MNDYKSIADSAKPAGEPRINGEAPNAHNLLAALIDIYDDAQSNPPESRCYIEDAWPDILREARAFIAAAPAPAEPAAPVLTEQAAIDQRALVADNLERVAACCEQNLSEPYDAEWMKKGAELLRLDLSIQSDLSTKPEPASAPEGAKIDTNRVRRLVEGLAEQQAMPDDWWKTELEAALAPTFPALQESKAVTEDAKDAARYRWLRDHAKEEPLRPAAYGSEIAPDMRLKYSFPVLVSYDAIGQQISLDDAIDSTKGSTMGEMEGKP